MRCIEPAARRGHRSRRHSRCFARRQIRSERRSPHAARAAHAQLGPWRRRLSGVSLGPPDRRPSSTPNGGGASIRTRVLYSLGSRYPVLTVISCSRVVPGVSSTSGGLDLNSPAFDEGTICARPLGVVTPFTPRRWIDVQPENVRGGHSGFSYALDHPGHCVPPNRRRVAARWRYPSCAGHGAGGPPLGSSLCGGGCAFTRV
jgi:hypothetical protein